MLCDKEFSHNFKVFWFCTYNVILLFRRRQQFGGRGGRGRGRGRGGRGRGGRSGGSQRANVTAEDLDAELDAYHDAV